MKHLLNFYPIESFCENGGYVDVLKKLFEDKDRVTWWPGIGQYNPQIDRGDIIVCEEKNMKKEIYILKYIFIMRIF